MAFLLSKLRYLVKFFTALVSHSVGRYGRTFVILTPFGWLCLLFLAPFLIILQISFSESQTNIPPYSDLMHWVGKGIVHIQVNFNNYMRLFDDTIYATAFQNSIFIASVSTLLALVVGYPMAYAIARSRPTLQTFLLMMVMLPFWTSFLIRVYAWIGMLSKHGVINNFLIKVGLLSAPITILYSNFAVVIGVVYAYLPFMVLPLYASLVKIDQSFLEASSDLGCRPLRSFMTVTLPLSMPGIIAGSLLVFVPVMGEYVIPELLGGTNSLMIGRIIWDEFFINRNWPVACAVAIVLVVVLVLPIMFFQRFQSPAAEQKQ